MTAYCWTKDGMMAATGESKTDGRWFTEEDLQAREAALREALTETRIALYEVITNGEFGKGDGWIISPAVYEMVRDAHDKAQQALDAGGR